MPGSVGTPGSVRRPTGGWSHGLFHGDALVAVAATDTLIRARVAGLGRDEAIELSRLCAARPDLCRVVLRLWRAFVFPELAARRGYCWAVSYQDAQARSGNLYRFDGWRRLSESRSGVDTRTGRAGRRKIVWGWYEPHAPADDASNHALGIYSLGASSRSFCL